MEVIVTQTMLDANPEWRAQLFRKWDEGSTPSPRTVQRIDISGKRTSRPSKLPK